MAHMHHLLIFYLVVALSPFSMVSFALEGDDDPLVASSTQGELGRQRVSRSPDEEELEDICNCIGGKSQSQSCRNKLKNYGPIITEGSCLVSLRPKRSFIQGATSFTSPPPFAGNKKCTSTKTIILADSGTERQLTLTTQASVFICEGSIDVSLGQLFVNDVSKIVIAAGALKPRDSNLKIRFSNLREKVIIPEGAFSVEVKNPESAQVIDQVEIDETPPPPPTVTLQIDTANDVEFKSHSIVAPIVQLKLNQVKNVIFGSNSIVSSSHPEASSLEVTYSEKVTMDTQTIYAGKFTAKYIKELLMREKAVEIVSDDGAGAKIEHVSNVTVFDEALSIGSGADILLNNLTVTSMGVRSIQGTGPGNIRRAAFTYVVGRPLDSVALCIKAETVIAYNVEIEGNSGSHIGACIDGQVVHQSDNSDRFVVCQGLKESVHLCNDVRCAPCTPETEEDTTIASILADATIMTTLPDTTIMTTLPDATIMTTLDDITIVTTLLNDTTIMPTLLQSRKASTNTTAAFTTSPMTSSTVFGDNLDISIHQEAVNISIPPDATNISIPPDATNISVLLLSGNTNGTANNDTDESSYPPIYIIIIIVCAGTVLMLFIIYMIYRCYRRNKHDKYYLPHENRLSTFRNSRTILTPENLTSQSNTCKGNDDNVPEIYTTYDSCRQPIAKYTPSSETLPLEDPCCSAENQLPSTEEDLPLDNQVIAAETEELPPSGYQLPSSNDQDYPPPPPPPPEEYLPPISEDHVPPPEGYIHSSDDQMPVEDPLTEDGSCSPSPDNQLSSVGGPLDFPENQLPIRGNQLSSGHQSFVPSENGAYF